MFILTFSAWLVTKLKGNLNGKLNGNLTMFKTKVSKTTLLNDITSKIRIIHIYKLFTN